MTAPELIASLHAGDTVALSRAGTIGDPAVAVLAEVDGNLFAGPHLIRWADGTPAVFLRSSTLTVTARATRGGELYANHPRPEPAHGDIVRDDEGDAWQFTTDWGWLLAGGSMPGGVAVGIDDIDTHGPLTLLWDAVLGQPIGGQS